MEQTIIHLLSYLTAKILRAVRKHGGPKHRCEVNNKKDIQEIIWEGMVLINGDENRGKWLVIVMVMSLLVP
jgi:hypothetical protein